MILCLLQKTLTLHNVIIPMKSVFSENQNYCYYDIFSKKCSYQLPENNDNKEKGIDVNKTSSSKECNFCKYRSFLDKGFKFQPYVCNGGRDIFMMSMNYKNTAILNICGDYYCCIISKISKINLMQNIALTQKSGTL